MDGQPFTSYVWPESLTKPVLYPLRTEKGALVTRGFPLDPRPGERTDHPHHVGLWFNYGDVNGVDFWNNSTALPREKQAQMGRARHVRVVSATSGDEEGRLQVLVEWVMPDGSVALDETTTFVFRKTPGSRLVDRTTTLTARDKAVRFPDNKEGVARPARRARARAALEGARDLHGRRGRRHDGGPGSTTRASPASTTRAKARKATRRGGRADAGARSPESWGTRM